MRIGHGYDIHRLTEGDFVTLAGVKIPCDYAVVAHSDGDVVLHAVADALLGATGLGDIGHFFPDNDPDNQNRDSREFIEHILALCHEKHCTVSNVDVSVIAETPKLKTHIQAMKQMLADVLKTSDNRVNIKATTNEGLGDIGAKQAIAAHAVVLLEET